MGGTLQRRLENCLTRDGKLLATYTTRNSSLSNNVVFSLAERKGRYGLEQTEEASISLTRKRDNFPYWNTSPEEITIHFPANSILCPLQRSE